MLRVAFYHDEWHFFNCNYDERHYVECRNAECRGTVFLCRCVIVCLLPYLSVFLPVYMFVHMSAYVLVFLSAAHPPPLHVYMLVLLSVICLFFVCFMSLCVWQSVCLSTCLLIGLFICLPVFRLSVHPSDRFFVLVFKWVHTF